MADDTERDNVQGVASSGNVAGGAGVVETAGGGMAAAETPIPTPDELPGDMEEYRFPSDAGSALAGEEYQGGDGYGQVASSSTLAPSGTGAISDRAKRLMIVVVAVLSVVIVMHFTNARRAAKKETPELTAETIQMAEKQPAKAMQEKEQEVLAQRQSAVSNGRSIDSVEQNLSKLQQEYLSDQSQIHQLRTGMEHVEDFLTELQNTMVRMRTQMEVLNRRLAKIEETGLSAEKQAKQTSKAVVQNKQRPLTVYYMKAAVRGRAWLQNARGEALTIKPGDQLRDYGVVQRIDPARGMVVTSSGRTIRYAPSDS